MFKCDPVHAAAFHCLGLSCLPKPQSELYVHSLVILRSLLFGGADYIAAVSADLGFRKQHFGN